MFRFSLSSDYRNEFELTDRFTKFVKNTTRKLKQLYFELLILVK